MGYHSSYFIINTGNVLVVLVPYTLIALFKLFSKNCKHERIVKLRQKAQDFLVWNAWLSYGNEGYLIFAISSATQIHTLTFKEFGQGFTSVLGLLSVLYLIAMPIINICILWRFKFKLDEEEI